MTEVKVPTFVCPLHLIQVLYNTYWFKISSRKHRSGSVGVWRLLSSIQDKQAQCWFCHFYPVKALFKILISSVFHSYFCDLCSLCYWVLFKHAKCLYFKTLGFFFSWDLESLFDKLEWKSHWVSGFVWHYQVEQRGKHWQNEGFDDTFFQNMWVSPNCSDYLSHSLFGFQGTTQI